MKQQGFQNPKESDKMITHARQKILASKQQSLEQSEEVFHNTFDDLKKKLSHVVIYSESGQFEERLLNLDFQTTHSKSYGGRENTLSASISATSPTERLVLLAQLHGTGLNVSQEILEFFEIDSPDATEEELSEWYFMPTNDDLLFLKNLKSMLNKELKT